MRESLIYFGLIAGMSRGDIEDRIEFLLKLLNLPNASKFINTLSGGQQRRMSLAVALLHEPELLILDEPTVGVDPVLRQRYNTVQRHSHPKLLMTSNELKAVLELISTLRHNNLTYPILANVLFYTFQLHYTIISLFFLYYYSLLDIVIILTLLISFHFSKSKDSKFLLILCFNDFHLCSPKGQIVSKSSVRIQFYY